MPSPLRWLRRFRHGFWCLGGLLAAVAPVHAGFSDGLVPADRAASGIAQLSAPELAHLDAYVARDVTLAREGGVSGFDGSFAQRLTAEQRTQAGLTRLTPAETAKLDDLVAFAIAHPAPLRAVYPAHPAASPAPAASIAVPWKPEVHGDVSLTLGGGHGSSFYGGGMDLNVFDPDGRFSVTVSLGEIKGKGRPLFYPGNSLPDDELTNSEFLVPNADRVAPTP
jgi:hypothetical protein